MADSEGKYGIIGRLTSVPANMPDDLVRYYFYWQLFYFFAGLSHLVALVMFWRAGVAFMAAFNVASVSAFAACFVLLRVGYYRLPYWMAIAEFVLHGIATVVCVGPFVGSQSYAFVVLILAFIQPFYTWRISALITAATLVSVLLVTLYGFTHPAVYEVSEGWLRALQLVQFLIWPLFVLFMVLPFIRASARAERELEAAYSESERLLLNILPEPIARRLKASKGMIADDHDKVAILFADIVGFTQLSGRLQPAGVVTLLNDVFNAIDELVAKYGVEKIKTIGDAYMVAAGVPTPMDDPDETIARLALDIRSVISRFKEPNGTPIRVRIGISSGKVVAGVIGNRKFAYDLWGDAVNLAARMEATSEPDRIQVPDGLAAELADRFEFKPRGEIEIKGRGTVTTSFLIGARH